MRAAVPSLLLSAFLVFPFPAVCQTAPAPHADKLVIYKDRKFEGPSLVIARDQPDLKPGWSVGSAKVEGGRWQLCDQPNYGGSCLNLSSSNGDLQRPVQSARLIRFGSWQVLGDAQVNRTTWDHQRFSVERGPVISAVRICAQDNSVKLHDARARFTNGRSQILQVRSPIESGSCTAPLELNGSGWRLSFVDVPVSTVRTGANARIRLEGR